jgi:hypothetical protein
VTRRICIECDHRWTGDLNCPQCGAPGEPLPKRPRGRPPKGTTTRSVRREIRMEPADREALDALRQPGETRNDADLRVMRAGIEAVREG